MTESTNTVTSAEIIDPSSTRGIYEEALAELQTDVRTDAKRVIAERIKEVQRLRVLLAKAEANLAELLKKDVAEIAMLRF